MKVDLPNGQWAEIADVDSLTTAHRLAIRRAQKIPAGDVTEETMISGAFRDEMRVALLASPDFISAWSLEGKPTPTVAGPLGVAMIEGLPIGAYDALTVAIEPHMDVLDYYPSAKNSGESSGTSEATTE